MFSQHPILARSRLGRFFPRKAESTASGGLVQQEPWVPRWGNTKDPILRLDHVSFSPASGRVLFEDVHLDVARGDYIVIRGPSGTGKTSFLKLLNRLYEPCSGRIFYGEIPFSRIPVTSLRRRVSYLHQTPTLLDGSIRDNLLLPFRFRSASGLAPPDDKELDRWLKRFSLSQLALSGPTESCSIGEKQRICFIRALILKPDVLLLDEPTSALDPESARIVETEIARANTELGVTVFLVTHRTTQRVSAARRFLHLQNAQFVEVRT